MDENELSNKVIGLALRVHKKLGPGLLESVYEECFFYEIKQAGFKVEKQKEIEEYYGLTFQNLTPSLAHAFSFESTHGIVVSDVKEGSHAEKDSLKRGDIIDEVGGQAVTDMASMRNALKSRKTAVQARIFRKGHYLFVTLHPD